MVESCNIINFNFYNLNLLVHGTNPLHMLGGVVRTGMRRDVVTRDTHDATTWRTRTLIPDRVHTGDSI